MAPTAVLLDATDRKILRILNADARTAWSRVAEQVGLSSPSTVDRVRKLERLGVIRGYQLRTDADALGYSLLAFVAVENSDPAYHEEILRWARETDEVRECHVVTGEADYLMKIRCRDPAHLEGLLLGGLRAIPGVTRTASTIVMATKKDTSNLLLPEE